MEVFISFKTTENTVVEGVPVQVSSFRISRIVSYTISCATLFVLASCSPAPAPGSPEYFQSRVNAVIDSIIAFPDTEWTDSLAAWPTDVVLPAITKALRENKKLTGEQPRAELLGVLHRRRAVETAEGRELFMASLTDKPRAAFQSIVALQETPESERAGIIAALAPRIADTLIFHSVRGEILRFLNRVDPKNAQVTPIAEKIFPDASQTEDLRTLSFIHLINAQGTDGAFSLCRNLDTVGMRCAIYGFEAIGGTTQGEMNTTPTVRDEVRKWVLSLMEHESQTVRDAAFRSLHGVYAKDYFPVVDGVYRVNPQIKAAIARMAEAEVDTKRAKRWRQEIILLEQQEKKQEDQKAGIVSPN